jgi:hypothetical protein
MLGPITKSSGTSSSSSSSNAGAGAGLEVTQLSSNGEAAAAAAAAVEQPVSRAFDQPGLQLELGYNLLNGTPILSASRRFSSSSSSSSSGSGEAVGGSSSSSWRLRQLKAAYDGKSNNVTLSADGAAWSLGVVFPTEATGLLGFPKQPSSSSKWPRLMLSLQPDVSFEAL